MAIDEVFPNPTVRRVVFQVRFPGLFSMENLVGEYQKLIIGRFPESKLMFARHLVLAANISELNIDDQKGKEGEGEGVRKFWNFGSGTGVALNVHTDSLDMTSTEHKTYANEHHEPRFRDLIEFAISNFLEVTGIPLFSRIGIRYINECPVPGRDTAAFREFYNTTLCLGRFPLEDAREFGLTARVAKGDSFLTFRESFDGADDDAKLTLDLDAYANDVPVQDYLAATDRLHELVVAEFEASIREPVYQHMRQVPEGDDTNG